MERVRPPLMLSIVIPVYNAERWLSQCLDSILAQTVKNFELLLVEDGATDASASICDAYAKKDARVVVLHQANAGVSTARNSGIRQARGRYLTFIDADDWVEPTYIESMLNQMQPGGFVAAHLVTDDAPPIICAQAEVLSNAQAQISVFSYRGIGGFPFARMFDREMLERHKIAFDTDIAQCEDLLFNIKYLSVIERPASICEAAEYHYRKNDTGAVLGRYGKSKYSPLDFTEIVALERAEKYLCPEKEVYRAWSQRRDKAAVATMRTMVSDGVQDKGQYRRLQRLIQKGFWRYLVGDVGVPSSKLSMLLAAISPQLEWRVYQSMQRRS